MAVPAPLTLPHGWQEFTHTPVDPAKVSWWFHELSGAVSHVHPGISALQHRVESLEAELYDLSHSVAELNRMATHLVIPQATQLSHEHHHCCEEVSLSPAPLPPVPISMVPLVRRPTWCPWHGCGNVPLGPATRGTYIESDLDTWIAHLRNTLGWNVNTQGFMDKVWWTLGPHWQNLAVESCRSQANRFFYVKCKICSHGVAGFYGSGNIPPNQTREDAAKELCKFCLVPWPEVDTV